MLTWLDPSLYDSDTIAIQDDLRSITYQELWQEINKLSQLLKTQACHNIGLYMNNCIEWIIVDLACSLNQMTLTPLPTFFSDAQLKHIVQEAKIDLIITDQPTIVQRFFAANLTSHSSGTFSILQIKNKNNPTINIQKITFTSGSTGTPKGVCLNNESIATVVNSFHQQLHDLIGNHFCLLPLSTLLENIAGVYTSLLAHGTIYLTKTISIYDLKPQNLASLFNFIENNHIHTIILVPQLLKCFVGWYAKTHQKHYLKLMALGGAKTSPKLVEQALALNLPVYEGYGLSESTSVVSLNTPKHNKPGTVGQPMPHINIKLKQDGEIAVKGANCLGYLNNSEINTDGEGYWLTGDLGEFDQEGYLTITGRKKNLLITPLGRNISPEWIEAEMNSEADVMQSAVFLNAEAELTAVVVAAPNLDTTQLQQSVNDRLPNYAAIKHILLAKQPFSVLNKTLAAGGQPLRAAIKMLYTL
jgi:long-subunit acyl-CoA synthetase (AMP-forming)